MRRNLDAAESMGVDFGYLFHSVIGLGDIFCEPSDFRRNKYY